MKIKDIERCSRAQRISQYTENAKGNSWVLSQGMLSLAKMMEKGRSKEQILGEMKEFLLNNYPDDGAIGRQIMADTDVNMYARFLNYYEGYEFVSSGQNCRITMDGTTYEQYLNMVLKKNGQYHGVIVRVKANARSQAGRSIATRQAYDHCALVAKMYMEKVYPGIIIDSFYLKASEDTHFLRSDMPYVSTKKNTNVYCNDFPSLYAEGIFSTELAENMLREILEYYGKQKQSCDYCPHVGICKTQKLEIKPALIKKEEPYVIPEFTRSQQEIVDFEEGAMRVCACAGSGKTSTLIGRLKKLKEKGVELAQVLLLAFGNAAAETLKKRCSAFTKKGQGAKISTINGMCFEILKQAESVIGPVELLTEEIQTGFIMAVLAMYRNHPVEGFSYGKKMEGKNGLLKEIAGLIASYEKAGRENFYVDNPGISTRFDEFVQNYKRLLKTAHYITYDEQISLCNELLENHPEILSVYQSIYRYVMVDEYQDINPEQERFIRHMVDGCGNILVVGDDDQSIYGFRGASSQFFLDFPKRYPGCREVVLGENFRTTALMVESANILINRNKTRVDKAIVSSGQEGSDPIVVNGSSAEEVSKCIEYAFSKGYSPEDIAILSTRNAPLEKLEKELKYPVYLAKNYLRNDAFFHLVRSVLKLWKDLSDDEAAFVFLKLIGYDIFSLTASVNGLFETVLNETGQDFDSPDENRPLFKELNLLKVLLESCEEHEKMESLVNAFSTVTGYDYSNAAEVLTEIIRKQNILTKEELLSYMDSCITCGSDTRVDVAPQGRIALVTMHDSKGCEYRVTIVINDFSKGNLTEEVRRLMYVAVTRGKELEFILQDRNATHDFVSEIPHVEFKEAM